MKATIYQKSSGQVVQLVEMPEDSVRLQTRGRADLAHLAGWWPSDEYRIERGQPVKIGPTLPFSAQVRDEASRRINSLYPTWKQLNILRTGKIDEVLTMGKYIDAVRTASNRMNPAPHDYTDDKHWPAMDLDTQTL